MNFGSLDKYHSTEYEDKKRLREKIEQDIQKYLDAGGEIQQCEGLIERPDYARPVYIHKEGSA